MSEREICDLCKEEIVRSKYESPDYWDGKYYHGTCHNIISVLKRNESIRNKIRNILAEYDKQD